MTDKNFQLTVEAMRSETIRYVVMTFCLILLLFYVKRWFVNDGINMREEMKNGYSQGKSLNYV